MAIPTLFKPVLIDGRVLVDGGIVNPVPVDALPAEVDLVVAVDVVSYPEPADGKALPGALEAVLEPGELRSFEAVESIVLRTGNGEGVQVTLNGQKMPLEDFARQGERFHQPQPAVLGIPMELRSQDGVHGHPLPPNYGREFLEEMAARLFELLSAQVAHKARHELLAFEKRFQSLNQP